MLKKLADYFEVSIYYYNPNIFPAEEYHLRLHEQAKIIECLELEVPLIVPPYDYREYLTQIKGLEYLPEGDRRCFACYALRMKKPVNTPKAWFRLLYDYFVNQSV